MPVSIRKNKIFFKKIKEYILSRNVIYDDFLTEEFLDDKDIILKDIETTVGGKLDVWNSMSKRLKNDPDIIFKLFSVLESWNIPFFLKKLREIDSFVLKNSKFILNVFSLNPLSSILENVDPILLADEDFMLKAIEIHPMAFGYTNERLRNDRDFQIKAIKKNPLLKADNYIPREVRTDPEVKNIGDKITVIKAPYLPMYLNFQTEITKEDTLFFKKNIKAVLQIAKTSKLPKFSKALTGDLYVGDKPFFKKNFGRQDIPELAAASYEIQRDVIFYYTDTPSADFVRDILHEIGHKYHNTMIKNGMRNEEFFKLWADSVNTCELPQIGDPLSDLREDWWSVRTSSENEYYLRQIVNDEYIYVNNQGLQKKFNKRKIVELVGCPSQYGSTNFVEWFAEMCNLINLGLVRSAQKRLADKFLELVVQELK